MTITKRIFGSYPLMFRATYPTIDPAQYETWEDAIEAGEAEKAAELEVVMARSKAA